MGEYSVANGVLDNRWTPDSKVVNKKRGAPDLKEMKLTYCEELL
jgi:hypothetical protein